MSNDMDASESVKGYKPPLEFEEDGRELLTDLSLSDSTELWLIQWPANQLPDFDGQELPMVLHRDGQLGSFQGSSGKSYNVVSSVAQEPGASVFLSSSLSSKLVGKISRRVSFVHYPEPEELEKVISSGMKSVYQKSSGVSLTTSRQTTTFRSPHSSSRRTGSTRSSKPRSSLSELQEPRQPSSRKHEPEPSEFKDSSGRDSSKRKRTHEPGRSSNHSAQTSGRGHSAVTFSGSSGQSDEKSRVKKQKKMSSLQP